MKRLPFDKLTAFGFFSIAILALLILPAGVEGATYYVDSAAAGGGNGTITTPWDHPDDMSGIVGNNDIVYFARGSVFYNCASTLGGTGITIGAYGSGALPIMHGGKDTSTEGDAWADEGGGVYSKANITTGECEFVVEDEIALSVATAAACADGNWYWNAVNDTLYYKPTSGTPASHTIYRVYRGSTIHISDKASLSVSNIHFKACRWGINTNVTSGGTALTSLVVTGCKFTMCARGIMTQSHDPGSNSGILITDCIFTNTGSPIQIMAQASGVYKTTGITVTDNVMTNCGLTTGTTKWNSVLALDLEGIGLQNVNNSTISGNEIDRGCDGSGIASWVNAAAEADGNTVTGNKVFNLTGFGIVWGGEGTNTSTGNLIANNLVVGCGSGAESEGGFRLNLHQDPPNMVCNNVADGNDVNYYLYSGTDNYDLQNNISMNPVDYHIRRDGVIGSNTVDYNCYYPDTGTLFRYNGSDYNFTDWKTQTSQSANSITADPLFIDPANGNFRLRWNSPCIDAGYDVSATITTDIRNWPRKSGSGVDIGSYEGKKVVILPGSFPDIRLGTSPLWRP